jgi:hypothetical protein
VESDTRKLKGQSSAKGKKPKKAAACLKHYPPLQCLQLKAGEGLQPKYFQDNISEARIVTI